MVKKKGKKALQLNFAESKFFFDSNVGFRYVNGVMVLEIFARCYLKELSILGQVEELERRSKIHWKALQNGLQTRQLN